MQVLKLNDSYYCGNDSNLKKKSSHKTLPISFIRDVKFFFDISFDDVNLLFIEVEKLKEAKRKRAAILKKFEFLTTKEREIFFLVAKGLTTKEIAKKLFVEPTTVSTHRKKIKKKLNLESSFDWFNCAKAFK